MMPAPKQTAKSRKIPSNFKYGTDQIHRVGKGGSGEFLDLYGKFRVC